MRAGERGELKLPGNRFPNFQRKFLERFAKLAPSGQPWRPWRFLWIFRKLFPASLSWHTNILSLRENLPFFKALIMNLKGYSFWIIIIFCNLFMLRAVFLNCSNPYTNKMTCILFVYLLKYVFVCLFKLSHFIFKKLVLSLGL